MHSLHQFLRRISGHEMVRRISTRNRRNGTKEKSSRRRMLLESLENRNLLAGDTNIGLYDPSAHTYYLDPNNDNSVQDLIVFSTPPVPAGWIPVGGDWNGDLADTTGLYDPTGHTFYLNNRVDGSVDDLITFSIPLSSAPWRPIVGDWNGDGIDTVGVYDRRENIFNLYNTTDPESNAIVTFGTPEELPCWFYPVAGDWNGDGVDTVGLYDKRQHTWYLTNSPLGFDANIIIFQTPSVPVSWHPVAGDWNGDGADSVGLYDKQGHTFYLNNRIDGSVTDLITIVTPSVPSTWVPVVGDWPGSTGGTAASNVRSISATGTASSQAEGETNIVAEFLDFDGNEEVTPLDVLKVINYLNASPNDSGEVSVFGNIASPLDANGDGEVSPADALVVINYLNGSSQPPDSVSTLIVAINDPSENAGLADNPIGDGTSSATWELDIEGTEMYVDDSKVVDTVLADVFEADDPLDPLDTVLSTWETIPAETFEVS